MLESGEFAGAFATTSWTVVLSAQNHHDPHASEAMSRLCRTYWPPLYAFLRRRGYSPHDSEDLVQGFFERFLEGDFLRDVLPERGRFRSFLLAALRHYTANTHRKDHTYKRGGKHAHLSVHDQDTLDRCEQALATTAHEDCLFDRIWADTVMQHAARALQREYQESGRGSLFTILQIWLAVEAKPGDYARVSSELHLSENAVAAAVYRMRQRYREIVREQVAHTVQSPTEIDEEMHHLLTTLLSMS